MKKLLFSVSAFMLISLNGVSQECNWELNFSAAEVGEIHNQALAQFLAAPDESARDQIIANWDFDPTEFKFRKQQFLQNSKSFAARIVSYGLEYESIPDSLLSKNLKPYLGRILSSFDKTDKLAVFYSSLDSIEGDGLKVLKCHELDNFLLGMKVARSSAYFWFPKLNGGSGQGDSYKPINAPKGCCRWLKRMFFGDVLGAMTAVQGVGIGAVIGGALTPGANVAILGGIGIATGLASATALIPSP